MAELLLLQVAKRVAGLWATTCSTQVVTHISGLPTQTMLKLLPVQAMVPRVFSVVRPLKEIGGKLASSRTSRTPVGGVLLMGQTAISQDKTLEIV